MRTLRSVTVLSLLFLCACAGVESKKDMSADELYRAAQTSVAEKDYEVARKLFDRIRDEYPFSQFAVEAELLAADMAFQDKNWEEAAAAYRSFEDLHPTHPRVGYAIYRRGVAEAELSRPEDRDQTATRKAAEAFQKLLYAYPDSEHAQDARRRLAQARSTLAAHELYVAEYYVRRKKYDAALARLQELVQDYSDTPYRDEALLLATEIKAKKEGEVRGN